MSQLTPALAAHWIFTNDAVNFGSTSGVLVANNVYLLAIEVRSPTTISGMRTRVTGTATGTTDMGIYDASGNKLTSTGAVSNTVNTTMTNNFGSNYTLGPGRYFIAMCPSNSTDTFQRVSGMANLTPMSLCRLSNTNGSSGLLPSATSGYTTGSIMPAFAAIVVGGLT